MMGKTLLEFTKYTPNIRALFELAVERKRCE